VCSLTTIHCGATQIWSSRMFSSFATFHAKQLTIDHRCAGMAASVFDNSAHI
jgi:hypothetical protein